MTVLRVSSPGAMRAWSEEQRLLGARVVLVPTMGALHEGHLQLVELGLSHGDVVVVSIFVNPLQFNRRDDFDAYPRPIDDDVALCDGAGATAVYAPTAAAMYPEGFETTVVPGSLAETMEGEHRPGHFTGVTTVVAKLFNAVRPHTAVFGQKDFQQLAIVRRMVTDLDMGIEIVGMPTVREADGLALSSRNRRLSPQERAAAPVLHHALDRLRARVAAGELDTIPLLEEATATIGAEPLAVLEYVTAADAATLRPVTRVTGETVVALAAWFGDVRLIDNVVVSPP
jgi:pantoate--beta-alanine ligase